MQQVLCTPATDMEWDSVPPATDMKQGQCAPSTNMKKGQCASAAEMQWGQCAPATNMKNDDDVTIDLGIRVKNYEIIILYFN